MPHYEMNDISQNRLEELDAAIASILREHPDGLSEYELIRALSNEPHSLLNAQTFVNNHTLFQTHFILFNALYRLQRFYQINKIAHLNIVATQIRLAPWSANLISADTDNKLYEYYADWTHYENTTVDEVDDLIDSFWKTMGEKTSLFNYSAEEVEKAWLIFELDKNIANKKTLKRRYHQLMHNCHPDKGGDTSYTQALSEPIKYC
jgi:hypothetical protein